MPVLHRRAARFARHCIRAYALALLSCALPIALPANAQSERLLATGGVIELEGSGGGGLTPWALITGLGTDAEIGASADCTYIEPQHFSLTSCGAAVGIRDRVELSYARQKFNLDDVAPGRSVHQNIFGAKLKVWGDAVFDQDRWWPQVAVGLQYKKNEDFDFIPALIGARHDDGIDFYASEPRCISAVRSDVPGSSAPPCERPAQTSSAFWASAVTAPIPTPMSAREVSLFS